MTAAIAPGPVPEDSCRAAEEAGLNASATPMQALLDGWLLRWDPGKARRSRCINALAPGHQALADKIARAQAFYEGHQLPTVFRITPFSQPPGLDAELEQRGWPAQDRTLVMMRARRLDEFSRQAPLPPGIEEAVADPQAFAAAIGSLRGTPAEQVAAQAQRLRQCPVPHHARVWRRDGVVVATAQLAVDISGLAGLFDVAVAPAARRQGLALALCARLLGLAHGLGSPAAYLQVEAGNEPARALYDRLGFGEAYAYHYRQPPSPSPGGA